MEGHPEPDSATAGELPARLALRARIERFARSRAAHRALPVSAGSLEEAAEAERRADALRQDLGRLSALGDASEAFDSAWTGAVRSVDERLDAMDSDVLARVDRLDFPSLRAHLPRAIEAHRREGIALLDVMLGDRDGLPGRLDKVEYLVTLLSTEEMDGRRQIVHDPVTLTAGLARLVQEVPTPPDARAIAVEIHQAASLDFDATSPIRGLARIRARKRELGPGRFSPDVLRAIVTYNARMFNWIHSTGDASRASDAAIEEILDGPHPADPSAPWSAGAVGSEPRVEASASAEDEASGAGSSALRSGEVREILAALRRRLQGERIGAQAPERIALALDASRLDTLERDAILADPPSRIDAVVARVAVVGLMLRDRGAIQPELLDLGITQTELTHHWVVELERALGRLVGEVLAEGGQYALAGSLSGIKTKHLLAARSAVRLEQGVAVDAPSGGDASIAVAGGIGGASARADRKVAPRRKGDAPRSRRIALESETGQRVGTSAWLILRSHPVFAGALAAAALAALVVLVRGPAGDVSTLRTRELARISPHVVSAYRSDGGRGRLLIGRIDPAFEKLDADERLQALTEMGERLRREGLREAMLYDDEGALRIHIADGTLRRPKPATGATGVTKAGDASDDRRGRSSQDERRGRGRA